MKGRGPDGFVTDSKASGGAGNSRGKGRRFVLVAVAIALAVAYPVAVALSVATGETFVAVWSASFPIYPAVALLILWSRPGNGIGRLFLMLGVVVPLAAITAGYAQYALPGGEWAAWLSSMSNPVVFGSLLVFLPLLFPTGSPPSPGWRRFGIFAAMLLAVMAVAFGLTPGTLDCCPGINNPIDLPQLAWLEGVLAIGFPLVVLSGLVAYMSLVVRYRRSEGEERLQIKWFTFAIAVLLLASVVGALASLGLGPLDDANELAPIIMFPTAVAGIAIAVGVAVLKYRLYDIDRVINQTVVYGLLTAALVGIYIGAVAGIGSVARALTGQEANSLVIVVSTLAVAALFRPLRARLQTFIDRRFYRQRYDSAATLDRFSARLRDQVDLESLRGEIVAVVGTTMQPAHASLWLREHRGEVST